MASILKKVFHHSEHNSSPQKNSNQHPRSHQHQHSNHHHHGNHSNLVSAPMPADGSSPYKERKQAATTKPKSVEPLDYETVVVKNKTVFQNDPQREMLMFPYDDVSQSTLPRRFRTACSSVPPSVVRDANSLLVRECIKSYTSSWNVIHYKYSAYSGSYLQLPSKTKSEVSRALPDQVFEVDAEADGRDEESALLKSKNQHITKKGWLFKGPDSGHESSIISFTRSFKRRYFYLKQQADTTYILEFHKDDKRVEPKGNIFLDSAIEVSKNTRRGKNTFEVVMQDKAVYLLAAETEAELESWVATLKKVIQNNDTTGGFADKSARERGVEPSPSKANTGKAALEHSTIPELQRYAKETDSMLAQQRKEGRQRLFTIYPDLMRAPENEAVEESPDVEVYKEQFGKRFLVRCVEFTTRLQANLLEDSNGENLSNPEPFFISLCLYDAAKKEKLSEDFYFDPNSDDVRSMVPKDLLYALDMLNGTGGREPELRIVDPKWLAFSKFAVFSVTDPHSEIYLVARIEKVLQGSINSSVDSYLRTTDQRVGSKVHKAMRVFCQKLGSYKMPFAWAARPVFKPFSGELDQHIDFGLYKADSSRISEEEMIKQLMDLKKPEKLTKLQQLPAKMTIKIEPLKQLPNTVTPSLVPVVPFPDPPQHSPVMEVEEFTPPGGKLAFPHAAYVNHLYVYPRTLKFDSQKAFPKARNIAISVEVRDSDDENATPLKLIYGRPGGPTFTSSITTAVLHHNSTPTFMEEVKIALPAHIHDKHHVVFKFYHVSCDLAKGITAKPSAKKVHGIESPVGYAWFPILANGKVNDGEQNVRVAMNMNVGYLGQDSVGGNRISTGSDVKWVDARTLFTFHARLLSTVYTKDQHLHNFFAHCQRLGESRSSLDVDTNNKLKRDRFSTSSQHGVKDTSPKGATGSPRPGEDRDLLTFVKSLHAVDVAIVINFLPTLFNQLFRLLATTNSEDVAMNTVRVLTHMVAQIHRVKNSKDSKDKDKPSDKPDILQSYVKYVFMTEPAASVKDKTVHEELANQLNNLMRPAKTDPMVIETILNHLWFFVDIILKSMAQHLVSTGRIKMSRNERFPYSFPCRIQNLVTNVTTQITQKYREKLNETRNANISLANFVKKCFTFMDRGFVFKLINGYIEKFSPGDPKILHEFKFEFLRIVSSHEHYIPLNLPLIRKQVKNYKDLKHDYTLSEEFRKNHFLVGLLLHELKMALNEIRDIRKFAITTLRNLLAKHSFDERYGNKAQQSRIANLYLPFITIILENKSRLLTKETVQSGSPTSTGPTANGDTASQHEALSARPSLQSYTSSASIDSVASNLSAISTSTVTGGRALRDPAVFAMISGQGKAASSTNLALGGLDFHGSNASISSASSNQSIATEKGEGSLERSHSRSHSIAGQMSVTGSMAGLGGAGATGQPFVVRYDKLDPKEVKDLLISFLYIVKNLSDDILLGWFNNSSEYDVLDFFGILEICMQQFKYLGRKRITSLCIIGDTSRRGTKVSGGQNPSLVKYNSSRSNSTYGEIQVDGQHTASSSEVDGMYRAMQEANLSSEVATIVLDVVNQYTINFKDQLQYHEGDNPVMTKIFELYLHFLQTSQSETVQKHAFGALRSFINKFPRALFFGDATMCGRLCYEILRCCNSRLQTTRSEACALMYLLMKSNFDFSKGKAFTRVHLQTIVAVSNLISDVVGLSNARFTDSLSVINSFAHNNKAMQRTVFPVEVKDLTKRVRTVLMATAQMKEHENDPEMIVDLQYCLAKSYTSTPELRKTWLLNMAKKHEKNGDYSEAAHCYIHVAALVAEYLKRRGEFPQGCLAFKVVSANVETEEAGMKDDAGMQDFDYTEEKLTSLLEECAELFEKAERYEVLGDIYRLIIPIYERKRDFQALSRAYNLLHRSYNKIVEVMQTGKRLLGKYFRVAFFGQAFFEEEDGKEYIYKEPKVTGLNEICERLRNLYSQKYGKECVRLLTDSNKVNPQDLDPKFAYIQVTHVRPYFDSKELNDRVTDFERNNNIRRFLYETPFTKAGKAHGDIQDQYKRRTILTTSHSFPYVKKRILVVYHKEEVLSPIEVAIDEMQQKVAELEEVVSLQHPDVIKLQLKLQGSVSAQVNAGPMAYADAFLSETNSHKYSSERVETLKELFREFIDVCWRALQLNSQLISSDQIEYQQSLKDNLEQIAGKLSDMFGEQLLGVEDDRVSLASQRSSVILSGGLSITGSSSQV